MDAQEKADLSGRQGNSDSDGPPGFGILLLNIYRPGAHANQLCRGGTRNDCRGLVYIVNYAKTYFFVQKKSVHLFPAPSVKITPRAAHAATIDAQPGPSRVPRKARSRTVLSAGKRAWSTSSSIYDPASAQRTLSARPRRPMSTTFKWCGCP